MTIESLELVGDQLPESSRSETAKQAVWGKVKLELQKGMGSGKLKLTADQKKSLMREATDDIIEVLPDGSIYVPGAYWRKVLNEVFDPGAWSLICSDPVLYQPPPTGKVGDDWKSNNMAVLFVEAFLKIKGVPVASAFGAVNWHATNSRMTYDDAVESARTNALMRCGKALGMFANCWERWADEARNRACVLVTVNDRNGDKKQWRRKDAEPFRGEVGAARRESAPRYQGQKPTEGKTPEVIDVVPEPVVQPPAEEPKEDLTKPQKILVIRQVNTTKGDVPVQYWIIQTDMAEFLTDNYEMVKDLEATKPRGVRIIPKWTIRNTSKGDQRILQSYSKAL